MNILQKLPFTSEIIFVDDVSTDQTRSLINEFIRSHQGKNPTIKKVFHKRNCGRGQAVADGFRVAQGEIVGFLDIDLEVPAYYIPEFVRTINNGYQGVIARRIYSVPILQFHRWILSRGYNRLVKFFLNLPFADTEAGFKFFRREKILPILDKVENRGWFWDTEVMAYCFREGLKIKEIPALFIKRSDKESTVNIFRDSFDYLVKLLSFHKEMMIEDYWQETPEDFESRYDYASGFGKIVKSFLDVRQRKIKQSLKIGRGEKFLDVGCGSGVILEEIIRRGGAAVGLDYSQRTLDLAKKRLGSYSDDSFELVLGNAQSLPFENESFNGVIASGLLDYIEETKQVLSELQRVLKQEGTLIVTAPKRFSPFWFLRTSWGNFLREKFLGLPPIIKWFSEDEIKGLLGECQFEIKGVDSVFATAWIFRCKKTKN